LKFGYPYQLSLELTEIKGLRLLLLLRIK